MRLILLTLLFYSQVQAADIGLSVRALGMGNAFTTVVNNSDAAFYNPAGYAKMGGIHWTIADFSFGTDAIDSYQTFLDIAEDTSDVAQVMSDLYGQDVSVFGGGKSILSIGGFALGAYGLMDANFAINNPVYPNIDALYRVDFGFVLGGGFELIPNMLDIGLQTRRVSRTGGEIPIGASTIATLQPDAIQDQLNRTGVGYAFDWGMTFKFPGALQPTVAFTWRDMGNTSFEPSGSGLAPQPTQQEQIIGLGLNYESLFMDIRPAIDYRFLNDSQGRQLGKKINMGIEFSWPVIDVRGGFHQGYLSYGASFDLWIMRVDVASYGVELGEFPGQLEDRRYMLQMSFDFGVDPGNLSFSKSSRPSLKKHNRKLRR